MEILKGVVKKSMFVILPLMAVSALIEWRRLPLGIMIGWVVGIINLRAISKNVKAFLGLEKATVRMVLLNMMRLLGLFSAIAILVYLKLISIIGFLIGFTVVILFIIIEGLLVAR
ncbi:MAG: hypothetical protein Fur0020_11030 [Thermodesulfovibrionia bacterium]